MIGSAASLFSPISIRGCSLPNRIVMAPMTRNFSTGGVPSEGAIDYYRRRAEGGAGLILTEEISPSVVEARTDRVPHLFGEAALDMWRRVVDAVHEVGGKIMAQIWHSGLGRVRAASADPSRLAAGPLS